MPSIVRAPNHLGDVIMALPALTAAGHDVMVVRRLAPILEMAGLSARPDRPVRILPLDRGRRGFRDAVGRLRARGYDRGYLMTRSLSAAILFRAGGVSWLRGTATDMRSPLLADAFPREDLGDRHRILQYLWLLEQPADGPPRNRRITPPAREVERWAAELGTAGRGGRGGAGAAHDSGELGEPGGAGHTGGTGHTGGPPVVALFPGSNAPARRWPADRFAELGWRLAADGARVVVLGGAGETALTAGVAGAVPGALDAGGRTDLYGLAALLSLCDVLVSNDTGPMHLAGLVGSRTVTLWGSSSPREVRPVGARDLQVTGDRIPCMPCKKNHCPRSGTGYVLPDADTECMRLIPVGAVLTAVRMALAGRGPA